MYAALSDADKLSRIAHVEELKERIRAEFTEEEQLAWEREIPVNLKKLEEQNEALRNRLQMELTYKAYPFFQYPAMPPGFGYSQNTSIADSTSVGVLPEEDAASLASSEVAAKSADASQASSKRSIKLSNKVYFHIVEASNALQKQLIARATDETKIVKLNSSSVAKLAKLITEVGSRTQPEAMSHLQTQLAEIIPLLHFCTEKEFLAFVQKILPVLQ